jgi:ComF family protein
MLNSLLQLFFPGRCAGCDGDCEEGASFCRICDISVLPIEKASRRPFGPAWAGFEFGGAVAAAIKRLKFGGRPELAGPLMRRMPFLGDAFAGADLVVPVPLHVKRLREREFNQAAVLALAARPPIRFSPHALLRVRHTVPQTTLSPDERRANVQGAFRAEPRLVAGRRILVVDDVMTTGATADACARALMEAGAVAVGVLTVARAVP